MSALSWRSLPYEPSRFLVKGTELAMAFVPGTLSRFAVFETRGGKDEQGHPTLVYRLKDAGSVSDAELRAGKRPATVGVFAEPDAAVDVALRLECPQ